MKTFSVAAALAAATTVFALPSPTEDLVARASSASLPAITVKGNGTTSENVQQDSTNII